MCRSVARLVALVAFLSLEAAASEPLLTIRQPDQLVSEIVVLPGDPNGSGLGIELRIDARQLARASKDELRAALAGNSGVLSDFDLGLLRYRNSRVFVDGIEFESQADDLGLTIRGHVEMDRERRNLLTGKVRPDGIATIADVKLKGVLRLEVSDRCLADSPLVAILQSTSVSGELKLQLFNGARFAFDHGALLQRFELHPFKHVPEVLRGLSSWRVSRAQVKAASEEQLLVALELVPAQACSQSL